MYRTMEDWIDIRERVASGKLGKLVILRETGCTERRLRELPDTHYPVIFCN